MNKYMYLIDYWLPGPSSEHGGLQCIIASSDEECIKIIENDVTEYEKKYPWKELILEKVNQARKYQLLSDHNSGFVEQMIT